MISEEERKQRRYLENRRYRRKRTPERPPRQLFTSYDYKVVPNGWRAYVKKRRTYDLLNDTSPMCQDLHAGKTILVDYHVPLGEDVGNPFRSLYNYFLIRGYRLRMHIFDDVTTDSYRNIIMWIEPLIKIKERKDAA